MAPKPPPLSGSPGALVVVHGDELGRCYDLSASSLLIGRSSTCEIRIAQESVTRSHTKIINTGKVILVCDLDSTNGTYVNDEPIKEYVLRDGDFLKVGRTIFKFVASGNIERSYHEEMYRLAVLNRQPPEAKGSASEHSATQTLLTAEGERDPSTPRKGRS